MFRPAPLFFFATKSNSTVKATGVSSLITADTTWRIFDKVGLGFYTPEQVAQLLAILAGLILVMIGALRLGWLLRLIPRTATDAYATAVSVKLIIGQLPALLGTVGVSNEGSSFAVLVNVIRYLGEISVDAAFGIPSIVFLGIVAYACELIIMRYPGQQRVWNLISTLRFPVVIILSILSSWLVYRGYYGGPIQTVGEIDPGFLRAHLPMVPSLDEFKNLWTELPAIVLMMAVSQAALAQKLATLNGYTVDNSQELIALGIVNVFGPCAGGYLTMGSFSSSIVLSMAGSRSQLAGIFAALMVFMALYLLMGVFAYTPLASLAGIMIYTMLVSLPRPTVLYRNWQLAPIDSLIWTVSVIMGLVYTLEWSLYVGTMASWLLNCAVSFRNRKIHYSDPGVLVYRFNSSFCFINQRHHLASVYEEHQKNFPAVRVIVFDFEEIDHLDLESAQGLRGLRLALDGNTQCHFANVNHFWVRRALVGAGFDTFHECVQDAVDAAAKMA
jgi:sodium-independent sulfate anion transporter 11